MQKRLGIITLHGNNYGATLQAVALNKYLNTLGYYAENLNYNDKWRVFEHLSTLGKAKYILWKQIIVPLVFGSLKKRRFEAFRNKNLILSSKKWTSKEALMKNPPDYDAYIAGSDQIWNPDVIFDDYNYLLSFVPTEKKKIAYASSFGKGTISEDVMLIYSRLLGSIDHIAVREESGCHIIKKMLGRNVPTVLDPTLLLDAEQWREMVSFSVQETEPYILCYYMPGDDVVCSAIKAISKNLSKETGLRIINLGLKEYYKFNKDMDCRVEAGPEEFLSLFLGAEYVVTNSFHGAAFSVNFNKPLCVPISKSLLKENARHTRMIDFLTMVRKEDALLMVTKDEVARPVFNKNYDATNEILKEKRKESRDYLINAIEE